MVTGQRMIREMTRMLLDPETSFKDWLGTDILAPVSAPGSGSKAQMYSKRTLIHVNWIED